MKLFKLQPQKQFTRAAQFFQASTACDEALIRSAFREQEERLLSLHADARSRDRAKAHQAHADVRRTVDGFCTALES